VCKVQHDDTDLMLAVIESSSLLEATIMFRQSICEADNKQVLTS